MRSQSESEAQQEAVPAVSSQPENEVGKALHQGNPMQKLHPDAQGDELKPSYTCTVAKPPPNAQSDEPRPSYTCTVAKPPPNVQSDMPMPPPAG